MADVTRQRTGQFVKRLFEILMEHPEGIQAKHALQKIRESFELTEYEAGTFADGGSRLDKIVRFATIDCVKAGWMQKAKGIWTITEDGIEAYNRYPDPERLYRRATQLYRQWKKAQTETVPDTDDDGEKEVSFTFETAEEAAWDEVRDYLDNMNPYEFQELVADLLRSMGFFASWVAPPGKDGGMDIIAYPDPLGTSTPRIKVQVKRQQATISVDGLRSFLAVLGDDDVGIFVSLGGFTKDADFEARTQEKRKVTLLDAQRLFDLWVEHYDRLSDEARRRLPIKPIYFVAPEN